MRSPKEKPEAAAATAAPGHKETSPHRYADSTPQRLDRPAGGTWTHIGEALPSIDELTRRAVRYHVERARAAATYAEQRAHAKEAADVAFVRTRLALGLPRDWSVAA